MSTYDSLLSILPYLITESKKMLLNKFNTLLVERVSTIWLNSPVAPFAVKSNLSK